MIVFRSSGLESSIEGLEAHPVSPFDAACAQLDSAVQHYSRRYRRDYSCIRGTLSICVPTLQTECARSTTEASTTAWATRRNHMILARGAFRIWMAFHCSSRCSGCDRVRAVERAQLVILAPAVPILACWLPHVPCPVL